ncbi:MAG: NAD+ synthase [Ignisphaera sp.]
MRITIDDITQIDYSFVEDYLSKFLKSSLAASGKKGFVIGVSGGVDSATAYALAVRSVGRENVLAIIMPDKNTTPKEDVDDAIELVNRFGGRYNIVEISDIVESYIRSIPIASNSDTLAVGNLRARIRMCVLYYYANKLDYLVLGTSDRSEYLIGYFTKYGDGATDIAPLTVLLKTQVRKFGGFLGVPRKIIEKPSSPRLWPGHLAEEELSLRYEDIDLVLFAFFDLGMPVNVIPEATGVSEDVVKRVLHMYSTSTHKRAGILMPDPKPVVEHVTESIYAKLRRGHTK